MVLVDGLRRLDLRPAAEALAAAPVPVAVHPLAPARRPGPRTPRCELLAWRDVLLHLDGDTLRDVDAAPGAPAWGAVGGVHPALDGGPLVLGGDGGVRRWAPQPAAAPLLVLDARHVDVGLLGLAGDRLHVRRYDTGTTALLDLRTGEVVWRREALSIALVPVGDAVLESDLAAGADLRLTDLADGTERWRTTAPGPVQAVVAVVGTTAWAAVTGHGLVAVDVATGTVVGRLDAAHADTLTATVAPDGRAAWTTGRELVVVDLVRGVVEAHVAFSGPRTPAAASGGFLRWAVDRRLVLSDLDGEVWLAEPGDLAHPRPVHRAQERITGLELHGRAVWVLTADGTITVLA